MACNLKFTLCGYKLTYITLFINLNFLIMKRLFLVLCLIILSLLYLKAQEKEPEEINPGKYRHSIGLNTQWMFDNLLDASVRTPVEVFYQKRIKNDYNLRIGTEILYHRNRYEQPVEGDWYSGDNYVDSTKYKLQFGLYTSLLKEIKLKKNFYWGYGGKINLKYSLDNQNVYYWEYIDHPHYRDAKIEYTNERHQYDVAISPMFYIKYYITERFSLYLDMQICFAYQHMLYDIDRKAVDIDTWSGKFDRNNDYFDIYFNPYSGIYLMYNF